MRTRIAIVFFAMTCTAPSWGLEAGGGPTLSAERFQLENGLTVMIRPIRDATEVALLVLYQVGGDHDPQGRSGLAYLVEHLYVTAVAGTEPARTADAFFRRYPAGCYAQTGERSTLFATVFPKGDLEQELTEAAARMGDLRITAEDLDREKRYLLEELADGFGRVPPVGAINHAHELIRPAPRGGRRGGVPEQVRAITHDAVRTQWAHHYKPRNAMLVLAGAVDEKAARPAVAAHFGKLATGEPVPKPGEPGAPMFGAVRKLTVKSVQPRVEPTACLAYAIPQPGSELYAPFLVLMTRFRDALVQPGEGDVSRQPSVYFFILEDPFVLGVSAPTKPGETTAQAFARMEGFVADTIEPPLRDDERKAAREMFARPLGTVEFPDFALAEDPYGVALSLGRWEQLRIDPTQLNRAFDALTEQDLRRAAGAIFTPSRHAGTLITPEK
jgi:zinc protease